MAGSRSTRARRYPSDMTDAEWAVIEPLLPAPGWTRGQGGSPGSYCRRDIVDAIRYLTHNGPVWRALSADLPHWRTVYGYVRDWQASGATRQMHDTLREQVPVLAGRGPQPTAAVIDSQSVKAADTVGKASRGYDARKKIEGRKRHLTVDVMGLIFCVMVTAASVHDRDGARPLLWRLAAAFRTISLVWADGGYAGKLVTWAAGTLHRTMPLQSTSVGACTVWKVCARRHHPATRSLKVPSAVKARGAPPPGGRHHPAAAAAVPPFQVQASPGRLTAAGLPCRRRALPSGSLAGNSHRLSQAACSPRSPRQWAACRWAKPPPNCPGSERGLQFCIRNMPLN